jgi:hypothetical protein
MPRITAVTTLVAHAGRFGELLEAVDAMVTAAGAEEGTEAYLVSSVRRARRTPFSSSRCSATALR